MNRRKDWEMCTELLLPPHVAQSQHGGSCGTSLPELFIRGHSTDLWLLRACQYKLLVFYKLLVIVIIYIVSGALVFQKFETGDSFKKIAGKLEYRRMFLEHFILDTDGEGYNMTLTTEEWKQIYVLSKSQCYKADAKEAREHLWNFWSSMDFCSTILTTIGYGGMVPHTSKGRMVVIVYAIPGMFLMMSYLNLFSTLILLFIRQIIKLIESAVQRLSGSRNRLSSFVISIILTIISFVILSAYLLIMSWRMSAHNANDSFIESLYFYVITMTTVGMGDISMVDHTWWGTLLKVLGIFCVGLSLVTTLFGALRGLAEANRKRVVKATRMLTEKAKLKVDEQLRKNGATAEGSEPIIGAIQESMYEI